MIVTRIPRFGYTHKDTFQAKPFVAGKALSARAHKYIRTHEELFCHYCLWRL